MSRRYKFGDWYEYPIDTEQAWEMYYHEQDEAFIEIADKFRKFLNTYDKKEGDEYYYYGGKDSLYRFCFDVIKSRELIEVWNSFIKHGKANIEKVEEFEEKMVGNIARLDVHNKLSGHDTYCGFQELKSNHEIKFTEDEKQIYYGSYFADHETEGGILSDYGLPKLKALVPALITARSAERKLKVIDAMLQVTHPRGDLSAFFVEGGRKTLNQLAGEEEEYA